MEKKRVVLARRNDDAGRVELLAATQVGRAGWPGLQDCRIARLISSRAIVLEPNIIFPSQLPSAAPIHSAEAARRVNLILITLLY